MRELITVILSLVLAAAVLAQRPEGAALIEWNFDQDGDLEGWQPNGHLKGTQVKGGVLTTRAIDWDPFLTSKRFEIPARPWQYIEIKMKSDRAGQAEFFWTNTTESRYGGFSPGKETKFEVFGDNEWHVYRLFPFWHPEKKIILLRFDPFDKGTFAVDYLRIVDGRPSSAPQAQRSWTFDRPGDVQGWWGNAGVQGLRAEGGKLKLTTRGQSALLMAPPVALPVGENMWATIRLRTTEGGQGSFCWATETTRGLQSQRFTLVADGKFHTYNVDLGGVSKWDGTVIALGLRPTGATQAEVEIESFAVGPEPLGAPDLAVNYFGLTSAINRTGQTCQLSAQIINRGGEPANGVSATITLPPGVRLVKGNRTARVDTVEFMIPENATWQIEAQKPVDAVVKLTVQGPGAPDGTTEASLKITPSLNLPQADYVPPPRPIKCQYDVGMMYFPGWGSASRWEPIQRVAPYRKPVLGWYDEGNPECADWQIKWAVENGIKYFCVDWYWVAGSRHLEHWLHNAYMKAKYRKNLKFCLMWANHNRPNTHSVEDWRNVTQYWIDHYFGLEEYYRINDMPAVFIWAPRNIRRDLGGSEQAAKLYALSQEMAKKAGFKGVCFVAMSSHGSEQEAAQLKREGYWGCTTYHWWGDALKVAKDPMKFPFDLVAQTAKAAWERHRKMVQMPYIPVVDTGWDARPWHGDKSRVIYGRTPALFEKLLRDVKSYCDSHNEKMIMLGPANEWGEGSYIEPCAEYGFEMYEKIRQVLCPPGPWPQNVAPQDVGLGPYDFPQTEEKEAWTFGTEGDTEGWAEMMGVEKVRSEGGCLRFKTTSRDPAIVGPLMHLRASEWPYLIIKMQVSKVSEGDRLQMFWTTTTSGTSEPNSFRADLAADGQMHTYALHVDENPRWRGVIRSFRFDPCSTPNVEVAIDEIRVSKTGQ